MHVTVESCDTILWLPLIPLMVRIVNFIVRGDEKEKQIGAKRAAFLDKKLLAQPSAAMILIQKEMRRMFLLTEKSIASLEKVFSRTQDFRAFKGAEKNADRARD